MTPDPITDLVERLVRGDPRAIARAISLVESDTAEGAALIERIHGRTGGAYVVGITGPPGAGKSTLVDRLLAHLRRGGLTVGVIAVDPSSPFTGGAILGDRVRMGAHAGDEGIFVRSMATRGHLGGLSRATHDAAAVLDASGKDIVIIETVGVGQDEVEIVRAADVSIVVLVPGAGDDVQAIKAGIMEIADIFVVNKADREGADRVVHAVAANLSLQAAGPDAWRPPVLKAQANAGAGVAEVWEAVEQFRSRSAAARADRQRDRHERRLREALIQQFLRRVEEAVPGDAYQRLVDGISARTIDPHSAAAEIMRLVTSAGDET